MDQALSLQLSHFNPTMKSIQAAPFIGSNTLDLRLIDNFIDSIALRPSIK